MEPLLYQFIDRIQKMNYPSYSVCLNLSDSIHIPLFHSQAYQQYLVRIT